MFMRALPVFETGKENEMNTFYGFYTTVTAGEGTILRIAGASLYAVSVNGRFVFSGPARTAHGYYCVDEIPLDAYLTAERNVLTVRLSSYNCNSFSLIDVPGFLCAEVVRDGKVLSYTDADGMGGFSCVELDERLCRVMRYSFQRNFTESYRLDDRYMAFDCDPASSGHRAVTLKEQESKHFLPRAVFLPLFEEESPQAILAEGRVEMVSDAPIHRSRQHRKTAIFKCYDEKELAYRVIDEARTMAFVPEAESLRSFAPLTLGEKRYADIRFPCNVTGFMELSFTVTEDCELFLLFDEVYNGNTVDYLRLDCANIVTFEAKAGRYHLLTQEPYTFRYLRAACRSGSVIIDGVTVRRAGYPALGERPEIADAELMRIYDAAVETFRQNTYDIFMDCPSRERAGWLCDSFFTGRVERCLTGKVEVERNFLNNFLYHEHDANLPDGMLPMCYPADHTDGVYIPNWAMWFVLELEEYLTFTHDRELIDRAETKVMELLAFLRRYENENGLLEKLDSWVFVEWSRSNHLVQDVNFPTNMLYARMKRAIAALYGVESLVTEAEGIETYIRDNTMVNGFFCDNALRGEDGSLTLSGECTESCQYYAFFMNLATPESHPDLWKILTEDFGPHRKTDNRYPAIAFANSFIGNYLRLDLLLRYGMKEKLLDEIRGYFLYMADKTGTLWENDSDYASCNHGFASYIAVLIREAMKL